MGEATADEDHDPHISSMSPMLRRRASSSAKLALEVAYQCLGSRVDVPIVFCSRHGEVARSLELLDELVYGHPLSPASFSMSVHNAAGGLFSIARADKANQITVSTADGGVEPGILEACGLLADGASRVMLVTYDRPLPQRYARYRDCVEQPFGWAWLLAQAGTEHISLSWRSADIAEAGSDMQGALGAQRFFLRGDREWIRPAERGFWHWKRHG